MLEATVYFQRMNDSDTVYIFIPCNHLSPTGIQMWEQTRNGEFLGNLFSKEELLHLSESLEKFNP